MSENKIQLINIRVPISNNTLILKMKKFKKQVI